MWESLLRFSYADYPLDDERKKDLRELVGQLFSRLELEIFPHLHDALSNESGVHVSGTEEQANSADTDEGKRSLWEELRALRITGEKLLINLVILNSNPR